MKIYPIYKSIKSRLTGIAPLFHYQGQYLRKVGTGTEQTSYRVPAIYIETPRNQPVTWWGGRIKCIPNAAFKLHIVSNAPHKANDANPVQDSALQAHDTIVSQAQQALQNAILKNADDQYLTGQLSETGTDNMRYEGPVVVTVLTFSADVYER